MPSCRLDLGTALLSNQQISDTNFKEFFNRQLKRRAHAACDPLIVTLHGEEEDERLSENSE